ncbi:MAG: hypothetical protein WA294_00740 [Acidobacteriaceae bacterium]
MNGERKGTPLRNRTAIALAGFLLLCCLWMSAPGGNGQETIVAVRHGEKPAAGLGQLNCKGLNRALALPKVLARYGKPDAIFAPDPAAEVNDWSRTDYSYVRPLVTIEPTAIALGMPVNAEIGFRNVAKLEAAVTAPDYANALIFIAWEHEKLNEFARAMLLRYRGDPLKVPDWRGDDYDRIYVFTITQTASGPALAFRIDHEGLDGTLSDACPGPAQ